MYFLILLSALLFMADNIETAEISVHSMHRTVASGESTWIAIGIEPKNGWHTYWANSGDAGLATTVEWNLPKGVSITDTIWQIPEIIEADGIVSYGFHGKHYIFYKISIPDNPEIQNFEIPATVKWLACKEKCLPGKDSVKIHLFSGTQSEINKNFSDIFGNIPTRINKPLQASIEENCIRIKLSDDLNLSEKARFIPYLEGITDNSAIQYIQERSLVVPLDAFHTEIPKKLKALILDNEKAYEVLVIF